MSSPRHHRLRLRRDSVYRKRRRTLAALALALVLLVSLVIPQSPINRGLRETLGLFGSGDASSENSASAAEKRKNPDAKSQPQTKPQSPPEPQNRQQSVDTSNKAANKTSAVKPTLDGIFAGAQYSVEVVNLHNNAEVVAINNTTVFTAASTYKLFVAYSMLQAVENGTWSWDSPLNGTTLQSCFTQMIVQSDNNCPQDWLNTVGYETVNNEAHSIGEDNTTIAFEDMETNASNLADFLVKLQEGALVNSNSSNMLLSAMGSQDYRDGIPAGMGSNGTVSDKVGFLDDYLHDAGIVYSKKGDFVFVIMTDNSSWSAIAQATTAIYNIL